MAFGSVDSTRHPSLELLSYSSLMEEGCYDINEGHSSGSTPLAWAAHDRHKKVVEMLLRQRGVSTDKQECDCRTLLMYAVWNSHVQVVNSTRG